MSRKWAIVVAVAVVTVAALVGVWWFVLRSDAPPEVAVGGGTTCTPGAGASATPADGAWKVAPGANVVAGYRIEELFGGDTVKKTAAGRTPAVSGTMTIAGDKVTAVAVEADVTQLASDAARRDNFIKGQALETSKFPKATFTLTEPVTFTGGAACEQVQATAKGDLTLHGVTKPVTLTVTARRNGETIEVSGNTPIALADYGITPPDIGFVKVDPNGQMEWQLAFVRA